MNKTILLVVGALVVIAAAVGLYFLIGPGTGGIATLGNTSLRSLLASNTSQKCTFDNGDSTGTIYVGSNRMRGDFTSKAGEVTAQSHMVISNNIAYVWLDGFTQGYRMNFEDLSAQNGGKVGGIDADARVATKCESWQANEEAFTLPTTVTFDAVGTTPTVPAQQNATTSSTGATNTKASASASATAEMSYYEKQCAGCKMITDKTAKAQCIASFDCPAN